MSTSPTARDCLWPTFAASAQRRGSAPALDINSAVTSFAQLHDHALRAAAMLAQLGVIAGDVVALQLPKRGSTYALILGCLRLGAIYAPLDPKNPAARTDRVLARIQPKVLFSTNAAPNPFGHAISARPDGTLDITSWPEPLQELLDESTHPRPTITPASPAYIMHTSGSTGDPKGAVIPHRGITSLMRWSHALFGPPDDHRFTAINPLHFDNSIFDTYCGLVAGATLVVIETADSTDPAAWAERITASRATLLFSVPTLLLLLDKIGVMTPQHLPHLRFFVFGGEGFPIESLRTVHQRFSGRTRLVNVYGPTETSCICSSLEMDDDALAAVTGSLPSLGRMHADFTHLILDDDDKPVPIGTIGELWIGGPNVGLSYFGNPEETARRFRQNPQRAQHSTKPDIYYQTGDLVRSGLDGRLWFQGRKDNQIKIAGHRVELEEIDGAVEAYPGIARALTILLSRNGTPELVTAFEASSTISLSALATSLSARLPAYMRPTRLVEFPKLPINANGKADRRAVRASLEVDAATPQPGYTALGVATETQVRVAWRTALGHDTFTATDSFFDVGGTSLALTQVHTALAAHHPDRLSMIDLFANPTVARITAFLERPITPKAVNPQAAGTTQAAATSQAERARRQQAALAQQAKARSTTNPSGTKT
jgi:D-alanine--poly(phosphoribitol) ligase subunit 1